MLLTTPREVLYCRGRSTSLAVRAAIVHNNDKLENQSAPLRGRVSWGNGPSTARPFTFETFWPLNLVCSTRPSESTPTHWLAKCELQKERAYLMGVWDFVKGAGAKVGIGGDDEEEKKDEKPAAGAEDKAAAAAKKVAARKRAERRAAAVEANKEARRATGLEKYVRDLGLEIKDLDVRYDDGKVTVTGDAPDAATREKVILAIGNTSDVETVEDNITVGGADGEESDLHVVVKGDTLSAIAKERYGDASKYPAIFEANRPMLKDPDLIYVGQVLRIPEI